MPKIWIVTYGDFEESSIEGVYVSLELAKAKSALPRGAEWRDCEDGAYAHGMPGGQRRFASIEAYELEGAE